MNSPEEANANVHPTVDAQSTGSVDTNSDMSVEDQIPAEITELRDLYDTAMANKDAAADAELAARAETVEAHRKQEAAEDANDAASKAEVDANVAYRAALRRHGYVQTADGPKPRQPVVCPRHGFVHGTMPSADYGADCNGPKPRQS